MTKLECAIVMAYTNIAMLQGDDLRYFYIYLSSIVGRPVYTHEIPNVMSSYHDTTIRDDFLALCRNATEEEVVNGET